MILELADIEIAPGNAEAFEAAFARAQALLSAMPGYLQHELQRGVEQPERYVLLVRWRSLEDHTEGFRGSPEYQQWRELLHPFFERVSVAHFERAG